jgi:hypothetical protein
VTYTINNNRASVFMYVLSRARARAYTRTRTCTHALVHGKSHTKGKRRPDDLLFQQHINIYMNANIKRHINIYTNMQVLVPSELQPGPRRKVVSGGCAEVRHALFDTFSMPFWAVFWVFGCDALIRVSRNRMRLIVQAGSERVGAAVCVLLNTGSTRAATLVAACQHPRHLVLQPRNTLRSIPYCANVQCTRGLFKHGTSRLNALRGVAPLRAYKCHAIGRRRQQQQQQGCSA